MYNYKDIEIMRAKAKFYSRELWGMEYDLPLNINNRLKRTLGWLVYDDAMKIMVKIELSGELIKQNYNEFTIDSVIVHELCHWYCELKGLPVDDADPKFQAFVKKHGGSLPEDYDEYVGTIYLSRCNKCGGRVWSTTKVTEERASYVLSRCCDSSITFESESVGEDNYKPRKKLKELNSKFFEYYSSKK